MADSNQIQMSLIAEATFGTTPASALDVIPITGGGMPAAIESTRSNTMRTDAQRSVTKKVSGAGAAAYDFEFAAIHYDNLLREALRSAAWTTAVNVSDTDIAAVTSGNKYTKVAGWAGENITVGQWVYVDGFTGDTTNNGWVQVTALSGTDLTVTHKTLVDDAAGETVTVKGSQIINGTASVSWSIQQNYADQTNLWHNLKGSKLNSFGMDIPNGGIITGSMAFDGATPAQASATIGSGAPTAASTAVEVMSEADAFDGLWFNKSVVTWDVMNFSWNITTPTRPRKPLGSQVLTALNHNAFECTGSLEAYLEDGTWALDTDWRAFTKRDLAIELNDGTNRYLIHWPQIAFTSEPNALPGVDSDIMLSFDWEAEAAAHYSGGSVKTMQICKLA